jgi:endogenous inhibitor of DNA gyrase (YacG/DUF329 family)
VSAKPGRLVPCPCCGKPAEFSAANRWRPFCSERCRTADLGAWASEQYRVPAKPEDESAPKDQGGEE